MHPMSNDEFSMDQSITARIEESLIRLAIHLRTLRTELAKLRPPFHGETTPSFPRRPGEEEQRRPKPRTLPVNRRSVVRRAHSPMFRRLRTDLLAGIPSGSCRSGGAPLSPRRLSHRYFLLCLFHCILILHRHRSSIEAGRKSGGPQRFPRRPWSAWEKEAIAVPLASLELEEAQDPASGARRWLGSSTTTCLPRFFAGVDNRPSKSLRHLWKKSRNADESCCDMLSTQDVRKHTLLCLSKTSRHMEDHSLSRQSM